MEKLGDEVKFEGRIGQVRIETWRHEDGEEVQREVVGHPGAVGIVAVDDENVWLVRQPREPVGDPALLEIPAGKLDVEGEAPLETAKRELAEEIGKAAERWERLDWFYTSPGFTDERVELFLATGLSEASAEVDENERIEIVPWPLAQLDEAIEQSRDAKSLIGLLLLRARRSA
jgi:8-oxo-dGTP pyrophosphatase MutT (NUDIX family)